jgi:hypothetical protein
MTYSDKYGPTLHVFIKPEDDPSKYLPDNCDYWDDAGYKFIDEELGGCEDTECCFSFIDNPVTALKTIIQHPNFIRNPFFDKFMRKHPSENMYEVTLVEDTILSLDGKYFISDSHQKD